MAYINASNGLALLAFKCAPCVFDLSSGHAQASIRDQIVRAQLFVEDLKKQLPTFKNLLVVGAGISGVTVALRAKELGMNVVLIDVKDAPFSLQSNVNTRYVGPFMYEWPLFGFDDQKYPNVSLGAVSNVTPAWDSPDPIQASCLINQLQIWLQGLDSKALPQSFLGVNMDLVQQYVKDFSNHSSNSISPPDFPLVLTETYSDILKKPISTGLSFQPDNIVICTGMGAEQTFVPGHQCVHGEPFWKDDKFRESVRFDGVGGVFGGGDGALQDVLRLLTRYDHPLGFIRALQKNVDVKLALQVQSDRLIALEQQGRLLSVWAPVGAYDFLDKECQVICIEFARSEAVRRSVFNQLRPGTGKVHHIWREWWFGRAYLLNRFVLHLIEQCVKACPQDEKRCLQDRVAYEPHRAREVTMSCIGAAGSGIVASIHLGKLGEQIDLTHVAVRYGPDQKTLPAAKMVSLTAADSKDRMSMAGLLLPQQLPRF